MCLILSPAPVDGYLLQSFDGQPEPCKPESRQALSMMVLMITNKAYHSATLWWGFHLWRVIRVFPPENKSPIFLPNLYKNIVKINHL